MVDRIGEALARSTYEEEAVPFPRLLFRVPPEPARLLRVRERLRAYLRMYCASPDDIDDVVLCVEEACTNAIRHSRSSDDLEIEMAFEGDWLSVRVQDHGVGFAAGSFDPRLEPDPTALGGRGLYLISRVMDAMELSCNGGTVVRMRRKVALPSAAHRRKVFAEEAGRASVPSIGGAEGRLISLLEDLSDGFVALDWEWRLVYANPAAAEMLRLAKAQLLGASMRQIFSETRGTEFEKRARLAMEQGIPSRFEGCFEPHGTWFEMRMFPTASGVSIYFNEINERQRIEHERD